MTQPGVTELKAPPPTYQNAAELEVKDVAVEASQVTSDSGVGSVQPLQEVGYARSLKRRQIMMMAFGKFQGQLFINLCG